MTVLHNRSILTLVLMLLLGGLVAPTFQTAEAQLIKRIKDRVKKDAEIRVEKQAVDAARRTLNLAEDAIVCAFTDKECIKKARDNGQEPVIVDEDGKPISGYEPAASANTGGSGAPGSSTGDDDTVGQGVWANYDFVSGDRVLYVHDFEGTRTGNFPSRMDYIAGNLDVVRLGSGEEANKVLRVGEGTSEGGRGGNGCFSIPLPETLPDQFTVEFRVLTTDPLGRSSVKLFSDGSDDSPDTRCTYPPPVNVFVTNKEQGLAWHGATSGENAGYVPNEWTTVALGCDGPYCKLYINGTRVSNVPKYEFPRASKLHVFMNVYRYSLYVDDLRVAEGGARSLYDDLQAKGFISTTAIQFDSGSATLKPASSGILNEILALLEEHSDLDLIVEGHTDSQGSDDANQTLSEQRAEAVAAYLIYRGIDAGRLDTVGFGESQPEADNSTPEGMAMNRRSVFRQH